MTRARSTAECLSGRLDDLVVGDVANVLGQAPAVPEGVDDLAVALAPEGVLERGVDVGAGVERALPEHVDVVGRQVQSDRCSADRRWASTPISGNSSASMTVVSPKASSTYISLPPGSGMRLRSCAPSASTYQAAARPASLTTRWGEMAVTGSPLERAVRAQVIVHGVQTSSLDMAYGDSVASAFIGSAMTDRG